MTIDRTEAIHRVADETGNIDQARRIVGLVLDGECVHPASTLLPVLERLAQAAEQYLDTEHRDAACESELRRNLVEACTDASLVLRPAAEQAS